MCCRIQGLTSSLAKVCLRGHPHYKHIYSATGSEHAVGCSTEVQQLFGRWFLERTLSVCAGGLSPRGTSAQFTPTQKQKKNKLHLCIKFFSKAAGVLWREWMLRFTRSSKVEVEALSSLKLLQEKKEKKSSSSQTSLPAGFVIPKSINYVILQRKAANYFTSESAPKELNSF